MLSFTLCNATLCLFWKEHIGHVIIWCFVQKKNGEEMDEQIGIQDTGISEMIYM